MGRLTQVQHFTKKLTALGVASLALGAGFGIGQDIIVKGVPALTSAAQADPSALFAPGTPGGGRSTEELSTIRVSKSVAPAVVTIYEGSGLGSGVIIDGKNGIILTNNHVVANSDGTVMVKLQNARTLQGRVLGTDPSVDVAVVKVNATDLPQAALGDSDQLEIGQAAVAIGNPLGLGQTVTQGVVSATGRKISPDDVEGYIQTDAAINPGNSGGPLLDSQGRVIGINTAVLRGPAEGLGFAVPINVARDVARQIVSGQRVQRGYMGVGLVNITPELRSRFNLPTGTGVIIDEVEEGSPASLAGLRTGDIITAVDGQRVEGRGDLQHVLRSKRPGQSASLKVRRPRGETTVSVRLAARQQ
jgi:S1-C subfamily serine protease